MKKKDTLGRRCDLQSGKSETATDYRSQTLNPHLRSRSTTAVKDGQMKTWSMERKPSAAICMTGLGLIWSARLV